MKKRFCLYFFLVTLSILPFTVSANSISSDLVLNKDGITKGESIKATIVLRQEEKENLSVFKARVAYDENIFEKLTTSSFKISNGWESLEYNPDTHALVIINKYGSSLGEDIVSFELKLKPAVNPSKTQITLDNSEISSATSIYEIKPSNKTIQIDVKSDDLSRIESSSANFGKPLKNEPVKLYYILSLIVLELIIAIILVLIYHAISNKKHLTRPQKYLLVSFLAMIEIASISVFFIFDVTKGDLDGDGVISKEDVNLLSKHIVNNANLPIYKLEKADIDGDGILSTKDIALLVEKSFTTTTYEAKLSGLINEENGYEKNAPIELKFNIDVTNEEKIDYVLINGQKYRATKLNDSNQYSIKFSTPSLSNKYNYNISEVVLSNGRSAKVDYDATVTVLKDIPILSNFTTKEDVEHGRMNVAFMVSDPDDAITGATYELQKLDGTVAIKGIIEKGKNTLSLPLENAIPYKLKFKIFYNRGSDSGAYGGLIEDSYDLKLITDYRFKLSKLNLVQGGQALKDLSKNVDTYLEFTSSNITAYAPKKITIDSREYTVLSLGNDNYRVKIPNNILNGNSLNVSRITLSNGKAFKTKETISYNILKDSPKIESADWLEKEENIEIQLKTLDSDDTIKNYKMVLEDMEENPISVQVTENPFATLKTAFVPKYKLKVYATFDRGYGNVFNEQLLYETTIDAKIKAKLNDSKVIEAYPTKNSVAELEFNITSNYPKDVTSVVIDNIIYSAKKVDVDTYRIEIPTGKTSGIQNFHAEKIYFDDSSECKIESTLQIDILKDLPFIENFSLEENLEENKITVSFDLFDLDSAFTGGTISIAEKSNPENVLSKEIIPGKNTIDLNIIKNKDYAIRLLTNAILDTRQLDGDTPNTIIDYELYKIDYTAIEDYELKIENIMSDKETYNKGEKINVSFISTNATDYYPIQITVDGILYDLKKVENKYEFSLPVSFPDGTHTLTFSSIILNNHKELTINCTKDILILKSAPTIENVIIESADEEISISPILKDDDATLSHIKMTIKDDEGNTIKEAETLDKMVIKNKDSNLEIEIIGTYEFRGIDSLKSKDVSLFKKTIDLEDTLDSELLTPYLTDQSDNPIYMLKLKDLSNAKLHIGYHENEEIIYDGLRYDQKGNILFANFTSNRWFKKEDILTSIEEIRIGRLEDGMLYLD